MLKTLFNPGKYPSVINFTLLILRFAGGAFMLTHGIGKFVKLTGSDPIKFADPLGIGATASLSLAVFTEVFCAIFLIVGFSTRFSAILLLITMLVAAFIVHANDGFSKKELALLYSTIYLAIALTGAGKYSIDQLIYKR